MKHYGKALLLMSVMGLAACQASNKSDTPSSTAAAPAGANDTCGASKYQSYIGKPLTSVNNQKFEVPVRAMLWNSRATMDFNLNRLNFLADKSGNISKVYCG